MEKPMEKWRDDIEKVLSHNRTIDRWIIRDYVWNEDDQPCRVVAEMILKCMMILKNLLLLPDIVSDPELREKVTRSLVEAGWPRNVVDSFMERLKSGIGPMLWPGVKEATDEETREAFGDDD